MPSDHYYSKLRPYLSSLKEFTVPTKGSVLPISIDILVRVVLLTSFHIGILTYDSFTSWFQFYLPVLVIVFIYFRNNYVRKKISKILNISLFPIKVGRLGVGMFLLSIVTFYFGKDSVEDVSQSGSWLSSTGFTIIWTFIYFVYSGLIVFLVSPSKNVDGEIKFFPDENSSFYCLSTEILQKINNEGIAVFDSKSVSKADQNDSELAALEAFLNNTRSSAETITLESIFLGGLAFSGFISIVSSDQVQANLEEFLVLFDKMSILINRITSLDGLLVMQSFEEITTGINLFSLLAIITLCSSLFFMVAVLNRIHLINLLDEMAHIVNLVNRYNAKEEAVLLSKWEGNKKVVRQVDRYSDKIGRLLEDGRIMTDNIRPSYTLMKFWRSIGVGTFVSVFIVGAFFFNYKLSVFLIVVLINNWVYRFIVDDSYSRYVSVISEKSKNTIKRNAPNTAPTSTGAS